MILETEYNTEEPPAVKSLTSEDEQEASARNTEAEAPKSRGKPEKNF